jgi:Arc/MetJ family transcription regulator
VEGIGTLYTTSYTLVYNSEMRTNIVLNDDLLRDAMRLSGERSKRAVVEEALRVYVQVRGAERRAEAYRDRLRRVEARLRDVRLRESPSALLRSDRDRG